MNLPPDLLPLWERIKGQFRGTPEERSRAFLEYVEGHDGEAIAACQAEADRKVAALLATADAIAPGAPEVPQASPQNLGDGSGPFLVWSKRGVAVRTDAPRYYIEGGETFAYWRGAGAFVVAGDGRVKDGSQGAARVRVAPAPLAAALGRVDAQIERLQAERAALLERCASDLPHANLGTKPPF